MTDLAAGDYVRVDCATQEGDWIGFVSRVREWRDGTRTAFVECQESDAVKISAGMTYAVGATADVDVIV